MLEGFYKMDFLMPCVEKVIEPKESVKPNLVSS